LTSPTALNCCESLKLLFRGVHVIYEYCIFQEIAAKSNECCFYITEGDAEKFSLSGSLYTRKKVAYL
jgi:hypothetical protein